MTRVKMEAKDRGIKQSREMVWGETSCYRVSGSVWFVHFAVPSPEFTVR